MLACVSGSSPFTPVNILGRSVARLIFRNAPQAGADPAVGAWDWSSVIDISITYGDFGRGLSIFRRVLVTQLVFQLQRS